VIKFVHSPEHGPRIVIHTTHVSLADEVGPGSSGAYMYAYYPRKQCWSFVGFHDRAYFSADEEMELADDAIAMYNGFLCCPQRRKKLVFAFV